MARKLTGSLELRKDVWHARITVRRSDGTVKRPWYSLETSDHTAAKRKLARLVRQSESIISPEALADAAAGASTVAEYEETWHARRVVQGVVSAEDERRNFTLHIKSEIGAVAIDEVKTAHIRSVIDAAMTKGLKRATLVHIRGVMFRLFKSAWQEELIETNPVDRVAIPKMREVRKERVILTDEEIAKYLGCADVDLELRLVSLVARVEGGMRTGDLLQWDWSMINRVHFAGCFVPRSKTGRPQALEVPEVLRPFLRTRWEEAGRPESGPVFPVRRGPRAGEKKQSRGNSYARALRRDLLRAGVIRHKCTRPALVEANGELVPNKLVMSGKACCPNMAHDPLHSETATTLRTDFHSFRRAFSSALAAGNVNTQRALRLAAHSDEKVHMRYVMDTPEMRRIPETAIPRDLPQLVANQNARSKIPKDLARPDRFERPTTGFEVRRSIQLSYGRF
jgi:integrase